MDDSHNWIIGDSEDESRPEVHQKPPNNGDISSISQFTVDKIDANVPVTAKPSDISSFTTSTKRTLPIDTTTDSISTDIPIKPTKPPRPKPRPAKRPVTPDVDVYEPSFIQSSNTETNNLNRSSSHPPTEINSSVKADDPFKLKKNNASQSLSNQWGLQRRSMLVEVIDLLSDGEDAVTVPIGRSATPQVGQNGQASMQSTREPTPPFFATASGSSVVQISPPNVNQQQTSTRPAAATKPAPAFVKKKRVSDKQTPPSSPVKVRKRRRKTIGSDDDFVFEDSFNGSKDTADVQKSLSSLAPARHEDNNDSYSSKPEKTKKKEKTKGGKDKDKTTRTKSSSKSKNEGSPSSSKPFKEQTFKSKEFIESDEDEDDLILKASAPNTSFSTLTSDRSTVSVLPSISTSVGPSDGISIQPSLDESVLPSRSEGPLPTESVPDPPTGMDTEKIEEVMMPEKSKKPKVDRSKKKAAVVDEGSEKNTKRKKRAKNLDDKIETESAKEVISVPSPVVKSNTSKKGKRIIESDQEEDDDCSALLVNKGPFQNDNETPIVKNTKLKSSQFEETAVVSRSSDLVDHGIAKIVDERPIGDTENKENLKQSELKGKSTTTAAPPSSVIKDKFSIKHSIPRRGSVTDLLRRVNSRPDSPLASPSPSSSTFLMKSTRTALQRIAPLHPNRRTPPPPPPRPPPPKKTKKELEMEERLEDELAETVEGWTCMSSADRAALLKARIEKELGYYD